MLKNTASAYGWLTKLLHWVVALAVFAQLFFIYNVEALPKEDPVRGQWLMLHKSTGFLLFWLALAFVLWRLINRKPDWPVTMQAWQKKLANLVHFGLYTFIIVMPLSGMLMTFFKGYSINYYNLFTIKPSFITPSETLGNVFAGIHGISGPILVTLVALHILGALVHHFYYKDNVLKRML